MKKRNSELDFLSSLEEGKVSFLIYFLKFTAVFGKSISNHISVFLQFGFVNALIKKFLKKGIIKVQQASKFFFYKRYVYYLTPEGFSEKSKLVLEYVTDSLSLFRSLR